MVTNPSYLGRPIDITGNVRRYQMLYKDKPVSEPKPNAFLKEAIVRSAQLLLGVNFAIEEGSQDVRNP